MSVADRVEVVRADITTLRVDAIVNAANESLLGGGGVDGAIHAAAGPALLAACRRVGGCPTGEARITPGFGLPARHVIHAVGPVWRNGDEGEPDLLAGAYRASLALARDHGVETIAFPGISTGVYRFPLARATAISVAVVRDWLAGNALPARVTFCCFSEEAVAAYRAELGDARAR